MENIKISGFFDNLKVGVKLTGTLVIIFMVGVVLILAGAKLRANALKQYDERYITYVGEIKNIGQFKAQVGALQENIYRYVAVPASRGTLRETIKQEIAAVEQTLKAYQGGKRTADEDKIFSGIFSAWPEMQRGYRELMKAAEEGKHDEVSRLLGEGSYFVKAGNQFAESVGLLDRWIVAKNEAALKQMAKYNASGSGFMWILFASIVILVLSGLGVLLHRSLTAPLKQALMMMQELEKGHLSKRIHLKRKDEIGDLTHAMDKFADRLQNGMVFVMKKLSEGQVDIAPDIQDEEDEIGPALQRMTETLKDLVREMEMLTTSALEGRLSVRGNEEAFQGAYRDIVHGVNKTLDAVIGPINEAADVLERIAARDLTARMQGDYRGDHAKVKNSLNMAIETLDKALQQVAIGAEQVAAASVQVSTGGQSLSQGASEQASSLEEISSSLQEMSSMTRQNALNAREAKGIAEQARESADRGMESMNRMSMAINQIKSSSDATAKIVKTIDEIAFQTNLLALNAAVEAARAGDAGRGFAVVAEEVRNLAMRSAEAAKNTASLIEEAVRNSENGVVINGEVLNNFREITERINKVTQVMAEIAEASEQQDMGIGQVNRAVEQINQLTQQIAASAEESASAAQEMSSQSEEMRSMVAGFALSISERIFAPKPEKLRLKDSAGHDKKSAKAMLGLHPDPRKVIPLDERDENVLKDF